MIYDHYLSVRSWSPNFYPPGDEIEELVVWVCIPGLLVEYYDNIVFMYIGDLIRKMVKFDKNALTRERWTYARLCIQVNLVKPLLAMFSIKGKHYKIE